MVLWSDKNNKIIFYDTECILCENWVKILIRMDKNKQLYFSSIKGKVFQEYIKDKDIIKYETIFFLKDNNIYQKAEAILEILNSTNQWGRLLSKIVGVVDIRLLNKVYEYIAKNRYKWFGKKKECEINSNIKCRII